jgi:hypothetical protein
VIKKVMMHEKVGELQKYESKGLIGLVKSLLWVYYILLNCRSAATREGEEKFKALSENKKKK